MGEFDDDFIPVGKFEPPPEKAPVRSAVDREPVHYDPPSECPECGGDLTEDFRCGKYVTFVCDLCQLNVRYFPSEPLATWHEDEEEETED